MIEIIKQHLARYPKMQIRDAAKLIYQNEFGGGHMIPDSDQSLKRIQEEYESLKTQIQEQNSCVESIGNGMSRLYLSVLSKGMQAEVLNELFVRSANNKKGTVEHLEKKLEMIIKACAYKELPFSHEEMSAFVDDWKKKGYPAISHSSVYREKYLPSYRVVEDSYVQIFEVIRKIEEQRHFSEEKLPYVIAVEGMSGSGKTTLGNFLHKNFHESTLLHMDDYFLQPHQRTEERLKEAGGNVDYERVKAEILNNLNKKDGFFYQRFDCCTQKLEKETYIPWSPIVIIEGAYSHHPYFGKYYNLGIFCEITKEEQERRILERNGEKMLKRFLNEWIPKENYYFEKYHIKENAEIIL